MSEKPRTKVVHYYIRCVEVPDIVFGRCKIPNAPILIADGSYRLIDLTWQVIEQIVLIYDDCTYKITQSHKGDAFSNIEKACIFIYELTNKR